jgi:Caspase domain
VSLGPPVPLLSRLVGRSYQAVSVRRQGVCDVCAVSGVKGQSLEADMLLRVALVAASVLLPVATRGPGSSDPLAAFLENALQGRTRGARPVEVDGWVTVEAGFVVSRARGGTEAPPSTAPPTVEPIYFYGSQTGKPSLDQGEGGGNPFASALVELLARDTLSFEAFRTELADLTERKSGGFQRPELPAPVDLGTWRLVPRPANERRVALVLVFSEYSAFGGANSLPGAKHDMHRVAGALEKAGFEVRPVVDPDRAKVGWFLREFADRSAASDVAVLYATGHGVEVEGSVYLLPGDYPFSQGSAALKQRALRLTCLGSAMRASRANLVFYGGCRHNPFGTR